MSRSASMICLSCGAVHRETPDSCCHGAEHAEPCHRVARRVPATTYSYMHRDKTLVLNQLAVLQHFTAAIEGPRLLRQIFKADLRSSRSRAMGQSEEGTASRDLSTADGVSKPGAAPCCLFVRLVRVVLTFRFLPSRHDPSPISR